MIRTADLDALPVREVLPALVSALDAHGAAVLCAPPGTGKTTLVPLVLAGLVGTGPRGAGPAKGGPAGDGPAGGGPLRRIVVAEPRRIAARAAARRMAWLLGEQVGASVGFTVRGERVVGPATVVEVVTTGVLLQRLQRDQELSGVDLVILDECHERHLDADTVAAFLLDVRETLRPELRILAASATTDAAGWARLLGHGGEGDAPVVEAAGVSYPVETVWAPPARPVRPPHGMRVDPAQLTHVASVVRRALAERSGDVLCFLPGVGEIARVAGQLGAVGAEVLQIHGRAPAAVQDAALSPAPHRRVILSTAVAESSLTVPGVRIVVDSGLAREPRVDHARGLGALATVRASRAAGRQRAGRAGREAPGTVYRCWAEAEDGRLPGYPAPEIRIADLAQFALQAACWGDPDAAGLALLDPPPAGAMGAAREVLLAVGAVSPDGRPTPRGCAWPASACTRASPGPCSTAPPRWGPGGRRSWWPCSARSRRGSTATTWPPPGGGPVRAATRTHRAGARKPAAWNARQPEGALRGIPPPRPSPTTPPPGSWPHWPSPKGSPGPRAKGPSSWPPGPGPSSARARGCAARPGWPWPSPTDPRTPRPPACASRRSSTRTPPARRPAISSARARRSTGRTATSWPAGSPGSAPSSSPRGRCATPTGPSSGPPCSTGSAPRGSDCCAGAQTRRASGPGSASSTARSARPGPTWRTTPRCWSGPTTGWSPSCRGPAAAGTSPGSTPGRR